MDDPQRLTERGALLLIRGLSHLALGDVICIRSRPNALLHCRTAAPVLGEDMAPDYALPPNTQLTLEEALTPPWTATFHRWHQFENEHDVVFADRSDSVNDAQLNLHMPAVYRPVDAGGRTR